MKHWNLFAMSLLCIPVLHAGRTREAPSLRTLALRAITSQLKWFNLEDLLNLPEELVQELVTSLYYPKNWYPIQIPLPIQDPIELTLSNCQLPILLDTGAEQAHLFITPMVGTVLQMHAAHKEVESLQKPAVTKSLEYIYASCYNADQNNLAFGTDEGSVYFFKNIVKEKLTNEAIIYNHCAFVQGVSILSPRLIASVDSDGTTVLTDPTCMRPSICIPESVLSTSDGQLQQTVPRLPTYPAYTQIHLPKSLHELAEAPPELWLTIAHARVTGNTECDLEAQYPTLPKHITMALQAYAQSAKTSAQSVHSLPARHYRRETPSCSIN